MGSVPGGNNTKWNPISKYPHYFDADKLYDFRFDPHKQKNLADEMGHGQILQGLQSQLKEYLRNVPGPFGELKVMRK